MSIHVLTGQGAPAVPGPGDHLPTRRPRTYPSDTSEAEWRILAPLVPAGGTRPGIGGRPVSYPRRDVVDAIRYVMRTGCQWDALPVDFPPHPLVKHYFTAWTRDGTLGRIHHSLREQIRQVEGRTADPSAALLDSQTLRGAETVPRSSRGYDAGKKVNGRKRHIVTDTTGLLLAVLVTGAGVQDRDAGHLLLWILRTVFPTIRLVWADSGYAGKLVDYATTMLGITVQIVSKLAGQTTFVPLPRRWCVERTFSWINRCRRTVRDYERLPEHHAATVYWAMIIIMGRRLTRHHATAPTLPQPARAP
ncbi:IS5 family transposase [Virgisporangium ochraceum]|uniref:DDE transposase n=1 Tax=Virgisporangium ochraceum TaxID=65505 RepID=A0A8J4A1L5_9ACTN|nr:IS5 family transposase [Virgisporangium ochraceum]GIJ74119.1 DDE transposase [Virgisporangium ochraceum]